MSKEKEPVAQAPATSTAATTDSEARALALDERERDLAAREQRLAEERAALATDSAPAPLRAVLVAPEPRIAQANTPAALAGNEGRGTYKVTTPGNKTWVGLANNRLDALARANDANKSWPGPKTAGIEVEYLGPANPAPVAA